MREILNTGDELLKESFKSMFAGFRGKEEELIPVLQKVQEEQGFLSDESLCEISQFLKIPESKVYAVATFYAQFRFSPIGKNHILVCRGTACHVRGANRILETIENQLGIKEGETTPDRQYTLETVACIGACGLSPCIMVNKKVEAKLTLKKIKQLFPKKDPK